MMSAKAAREVPVLKADQVRGEQVARDDVGGDREVDEPPTRIASGLPGPRRCRRNDACSKIGDPQRSAQGVGRRPWPRRTGSERDEHEDLQAREPGAAPRRSGGPCCLRCRPRRPRPSDGAWPRGRCQVGHFPASLPSGSVPPVPPATRAGPGCASRRHWPRSRRHWPRSRALLLVYPTEAPARQGWWILSDPPRIGKYPTVIAVASACCCYLPGVPRGLLPGGYRGVRAIGVWGVPRGPVGVWGVPPGGTGPRRTRRRRSASRRRRPATRRTTGRSAPSRFSMRKMTGGAEQRAGQAAAPAGHRVAAKRHGGQREQDERGHEAGVGLGLVQLGGESRRRPGPRDRAPPMAYPRVRTAPRSRLAV